MPAARRLKDLGAVPPDAELLSPVLVERVIRAQVPVSDELVPNVDHPEGPVAAGRLAGVGQDGRV